MATDPSPVQSAMPGTFPFGRVAGVAVRLHAGFPLLLLALCALGFRAGRVPLVAYVLGGGIGILVHEIGHAVAARRLGYPVREVVIHPLRGSFITSADFHPADLIRVALAGPVANLALMLAVYAYLALAGAPALSTAELKRVAGADVLIPLLIANLLLGLLNLLPAFPLDGALALRSLLAQRGDATAAGLRVAQLSLIFAFLLALLTIVSGNLLWLGMAGLVALGTSREAQVARGRVVIADQAVEAAMVRMFATLTSGDSLRAAATALIGAPPQREFPVVQGDTVVGVVTRDDLLRGLSRLGASAYVSEVMDRGIVTADAAEPLRGVLARLTNIERTPVLVLRDERLVGIVTAESVGLYLTLRSLGKEGGTE
jgi:Zn-dependent protease